MNVRHTLRLPLIMAIAFSVLPSVFPAFALAQADDDQVKAANQAIISAALRGDQQAFASLVADELQWIRATGEVLGKAEFTKTINPGIANSQRTFTEESVAVYGDIALLVCRPTTICSSRCTRRSSDGIRPSSHSEWYSLRRAATMARVLTPGAAVPCPDRRAVPAHHCCPADRSASYRLRYG